MANFFLAFEHDLVVVPVINKIDLKVARPDDVEEQLKSSFDFEKEEILRVGRCEPCWLLSRLPSLQCVLVKPMFNRSSFVFRLFTDISEDGLQRRVGATSCHRENSAVNTP